MSTNTPSHHPNPQGSSPIAHLAGTLVIHADAAFLNGAGLESGEDRNAVAPKTMRIRQGHRILQIPYVSAQAWRRWLRNTANEENGWDPSELRSVGESKKGSTNKIATECDPVQFPEDDLFGYMKAAKKNKSKSKKKSEKKQVATDDSDESADDLIESTDDSDESADDSGESIQRTSAFRSSYLRAIVGSSEISRDEAFVHLKDGTPLPYSTKFYSAHLQGIFGLDVQRLGCFENVGNKQELDSKLLKTLEDAGLIRAISSDKKAARYQLTDEQERWRRAAGLMRALVRLRGGAKLAAFTTDVTPKVLIFAGLKSGNLLFNDIFLVEKDGLALNIPLFRQICQDYKEHFRTPVYLGLRESYLINQSEIRELQIDGCNIVHGSPVEVVEEFCRTILSTSFQTSSSTP